MKTLSEKHKEYYRNDFQNTKITHIEFCKFLEKHALLKPGTTVCDMACGTGSGTYHYAKMHPEINFVGIDYNTEAIKWGNDYLKKLGINNLVLQNGDWYALDKKYSNLFDGIFSIHSFCTLKHIENSIDALIYLNPRWIALNSLFYEGPLDVLIHIRDHTRPELTDDIPDGDFNIFSLSKLKEHLYNKGYYNIKYEKFHITIDIKKPKDNGRGTYTVKTEFNDRAQFSGPVYLPWYFVFAAK